MLHKLFQWLPSQQTQPNNPDTLQNGVGADHGQAPIEQRQLRIHIVDEELREALTCSLNSMADALSTYHQREQQAMATEKRRSEIESNIWADVLIGMLIAVFVVAVIYSNHEESNMRCCRYPKPDFCAKITENWINKFVSSRHCPLLLLTSPVTANRMNE